MIGMIAIDDFFDACFEISAREVRIFKSENVITWISIRILWTWYIVISNIIGLGCGALRGSDVSKDLKYIFFDLN